MVPQPSHAGAAALPRRQLPLAAPGASQATHCRTQLGQGALADACQASKQATALAREVTFQEASHALTAQGHAGKEAGIWNP